MITDAFNRHRWSIPYYKRYPSNAFFSMRVYADDFQYVFTIHQSSGIEFKIDWSRKFSKWLCIFINKYSDFALVHNYSSFNIEYLMWSSSFSPGLIIHFME